MPPEQDGAFVAGMERVLDVYARPCDPQRPVVCMDEQPCRLLSETRAPRPTAPGRPRAVDHEYVREGTCTVWMFAEPLGGWRDVRVTGRRAAADRAERMRALADAPRFAAAGRITVVCDNLDTHDPGSLCEAFAPAEAKRIMDRLDLVFTPKHGSWLNIAECELSVPTRQSLGDRLADAATVACRAAAWTRERNADQTGVDWHFTTADARTKLKRLYPKVET